MNSWPALTLLTLTPILGAAAVCSVPAKAVRATTRSFTLLAFAELLAVLAGFNPSLGTLQWTEKHAWIPSLGVDYFVGVDGLSLLLVALSVLLPPFALEIAGERQHRDRGFCALVLVLQAALLGTFTALNFIHWFLYWELGLVPAYFLIKLWGREQAPAAATQFLIYTFGGSVAMLIAMQGVFLATGTFDLLQLRDLAASGELAQRWAQKLPALGIDVAAVRLLLFLGVFVGLAVKVPLFPFHSWLAPTYASAPPCVTMLLTGAMSKMGVYGFLRILLPIFPTEVRALLGLLVALAVVSILFAAWAALAQPDLRRMLAYSSMNHLGYSLLGMLVALDPAASSILGAAPAATALSGAVLQLFNHGLTAATLFACVELLERRTGGTCRFDQLGGLRRVAPVFAGVMGFAIFASLGLPGLNGFISEFLIFAGVFPIAPLAAALALPGLLISAWFLLSALQRIFFGPLAEGRKGFSDLTRGDLATLVPALGLMLLLGVLPQLALRWINPSVLHYLQPFSR